MSKRIGASKLSAVDPNILSQLESGTLESATLSEGLAIRMDRLMNAVAPSIPSEKLDGNAGVVARMANVGRLFREHLRHDELFQMASHSSDTVRGWAAFAIGQDETISAKERVELMLPFAADTHFGVREWAWMAIRAIAVSDTDMTLNTLAPWALNSDPNVRRFASEATRPRGVWAASIPLLRAHPERGLPILNALRFDSERYVEDSVANWLNDSGKDNAEWLKKLLEKWTSEGVSEHLVKRAGRSLKG
jgi:3-methyladenine DNA glycosylase AlkC